MIEIIKINCFDENEAKKYERYYIENLKATLNKNIPTRTQREYYESNRESIAKYYEDNKEVIAEKHKKYYESNRESIAEQRKNYYENNKCKKNCNCGGCYNTLNKSNHYKTKKHQNFILSNPE